MEGNIIRVLLRGSSWKNLTVVVSSLVPLFLRMIRRHFCGHSLRTTQNQQDKWLNPLFEGYGILADCASKIQLACAMRLISRDMVVRLEIVRRLRNSCAHESGPMDFDDPRSQGPLRVLIADGKPPRKDEEDLKSLLAGVQVLSKKQLTNRIALALALAHLWSEIEIRTEILDISKGTISGLH